MPLFELQGPDGATFEIEAPHQQAAVDAFRSYQAPTISNEPAGPPAPSFRQATPAGSYPEGEEPIVPPWAGPTTSPAPTNPGGGALPVVRDDIPQGVAAGVRGAAQGGTLGFADEVYGAGAGLRSLQRGEGFQKGYQAARDAYRADDKAAQAKQPYDFGTGKFVGGAASLAPAMAAAPAAFGLTGPTLIGRMLMGGGSGIGVGGIAGFGEGEGGAWDQTKSVGSGMLGGAAMGAGAPLVGAAVGRVAQPIFQGFAERGAAVPGLSNPAARFAVEDLERSGGQQAIANRLAQLGPEARMADASPSFLGSGQGLAARPETAEIIAAPIRGRNAATNARLADDLNQNFGPAVPRQATRDQLEAARVGANPMYEAATTQAGPVNTSNVIAALAARRETVEGAPRRALDRALEYLMPQRGPNGERIIQADARNLNSAKRALDDMIQYGDESIGIPRGALSPSEGAVAEVRRALNDVLEQQVPGYAEANLRARTANRAIDLHENAPAALATGADAVHPERFAADFAGRPIEQQAVVRQGIRSDLDRIVGTKANDLQALRSQIMGEGDWNRAKLGQVFGADEAERVFNAVDREAAFRDAYNKLVENSQTAARSAAAERFAPAGDKPANLGQQVAAGTGSPQAFAMATLLKGYKGAANEARRASDIARNQEYARFLMQQEGPALNATLNALSQRLLGGQRAAANTERTRILAEMLMRAEGPDAGLRGGRLLAR